MTENDYIAEYIKERHSDLLGFEYAWWKVNRAASELAQRLASGFKKIDWSKVVVTKETMETKAESEEAADDKEAD